MSAPPSGSCASIEELCDRLRQFLRENPPKAGGWLLGMGYDASAYPEGKGPTRWDLDQGAVYGSQETRFNLSNT